MEAIEAQLSALFNTAGLQYEILSYSETVGLSEWREARVKTEREILEKLLTALAPFKEEIHNFNHNDI